jgi:hypothetical protein
MRNNSAAEAPKAKAAAPAVTITLPFSWTIKTWPPGVYPYEGGSKARHLLRVHQDKLMAAGALTRIGHEIVVLGSGYAKWMASNAPRVTEYDVAANRDEHAHKRFGRGG